MQRPDRPRALVWAVAFFATFFPVGIFWMIWQYRAAANAGAGLLRRGPAMHAWSWAIPVVAVWFPYQNISDLHRVTGIRTPGLPVWWLFWLASALLSSVADYFATLESPEIQPLLVGMLLLLVSNLLLVAAAPLAWMVVARLTPPLDAR